MLTIDSIQLVVFDLDDTLYPESAFVEGGFRTVAGALASEDTRRTNALVQRMLSLLKEGRRDIFQVILTELGRPATPQQTAEWVALYRTADRPLTLFPDAIRTLERLRKANRKLAILTDGPFAAQQTKVRLLDLERRMDRILYTDAYGPGYGKPCPHCFEILSKDFNVPPERCIYIADNEAKDFFAPNSLGWRTLKVARPGGVYCHAPAPGEQYRPQAVVDSLDKLTLGSS